MMSGCIQPPLLTFNNPEGQHLQQNLVYSVLGVGCPRHGISREDKEPSACRSPRHRAAAGCSELSHHPQHPWVPHSVPPSLQPGPQLTFCSWSKAYSKPAL